MPNTVNGASNQLQYRIKMIPAGNGDCFLFEFFSEENISRMMVDCGPDYAWTNLNTVLQELSKQNQKIDVLLITHYCSDHIDGALKILEEETYRNMIGEIWYNGLEHIVPLLREESTGDTDANRRAFMSITHHFRRLRGKSIGREGEIAARQSFCLSLAVKACGVRCNTEAITNNTPGKPLGVNSEILIDFILPTQDRLENLIRPFGTELTKQLTNPKTSDRAIEMFERLVMNMQEVRSEGEIAGSRPGKADDSPANRSSISVIIRFQGYKFLFPGDAVDKDIIPALKSWLQENPDQNLIFDVVKLPHHGSVKNCWELLQMDGFRGKNYIISTDGNTHHHPDAETVDQLRTLPFQEPYTVYFNYQKIFDKYSAPRPDDNPNCTFVYQEEITQERT